MAIEDVAEETPEKVHKLAINPLVGLKEQELKDAAA